MFLLKRGLWLVFLELTIVNFAWFFNFQFSLITLFVIWALGIGMIVLAGCIHLPFKITLVNWSAVGGWSQCTRQCSVEGDGGDAILWSIVHQFQGFPLSQDYFLICWVPNCTLDWRNVARILFRTFYQSSYSQDAGRKILLYLGSGLVVLFVVIRLINGYGDPNPWSMQPNPVFTVLSFLNVIKISAFITIRIDNVRPAILFLAVSENYFGSISQKVKILGRVPMFYYLLHLYLIHLWR